MNWWTPRRLSLHGYVEYGPEPFQENIDTILRLLGNILYETLTINDTVYVRRIE